MKNIQCQYGCGNKAIFPPEKGFRTKYCCSKLPATCPAIRMKNSFVHKKENLSKKVKTNILCEYGCGNVANFELIKGGKYCCSKTPSSCENMKKINFMIHRTTIEILMKKHPYFCEVEKPRENLETGKIEVRCKHCNKWFEPGKEQLRSRICHLENKDGNGCCFLFCSNECKVSSNFYHANKRIDPDLLEKYKAYVKKVYTETDRSIKLHGEKIESLSLRGRKFGYQLDHMYSIHEGFNNSIDPKIVGHWKNLKIITSLENIRKFNKSTLTLNELLRKMEN
jgi:hypothetical protein